MLSFDRKWRFPVVVTWAVKESNGNAADSVEKENCLRVHSSEQMSRLLNKPCVNATVDFVDTVVQPAMIIGYCYWTNGK